VTTIDERTAARAAALQQALATARRLARPEDYVFDKAQEAFWDLRDGTQHSEKAVDASIPLELWRVVVDEAPAREDTPGEAPRRAGRPRRTTPRERLVPPSRDIMRVENDQFVEGSTWWPGEPQIIRDRFIDGNGSRAAPGRRIYNKYLPPPELAGGRPEGAESWVAHVKKLWPDPAEHEYFFDYCAHMVQRPQEKCNAAIVLSGTQGIGKDAALAPVKAAVGSWNCKNIDPDELFSPYKPWLETLMLVVDEVRPSKDEFHASSAYNILKPFIVAPPDTLPLNDKYVKLRHIVNRLRLFITTNDWMSMYIPPEDRRMFIMHSPLPARWHEAEGRPRYFTHLFEWMEQRAGTQHVAAWLAARDLSAFDPKAQIRKTAGWSAVAASWGEPEDAVAYALDRLGKPDAVLGQDLTAHQFDGADEILGMLKSPRKIAHRMNRAGYVQVPAPDGERWVFRRDGRIVRARYAFVRAELAADREASAAAIRARGEAALDAAAAAAAALPGAERK
jgi:hypothetical protein